MLRHLYVCRLPRQIVRSVLISPQAHRSSMDMAFLEHRGQEHWWFRMPVSPNAYLGIPLALFTGRTLRALETKGISRQRSEREATGQPG